MTEAIEKPLTREDVLKAIEKNGGKAEGLDLSGRNLEGIDFASYSDEPALDLRGIILKNANLQKADCRRADLRKADLSNANLQDADLFLADLRGAVLWRAHLEEAALYNTDLRTANLYGAYLRGAHMRGAKLQAAVLSTAELQGADLRGAKLQAVDLEEANLQNADLRRTNLSMAKLHDAKIFRETKLHEVFWGWKYIVREEKNRKFSQAADIYLYLKNWHIEAGIYNVAGEFYFREMEARRKYIWEFYRDFVRFYSPLEKAIGLLISFSKWWWLMLLKVLCGYGEKPFRVVASAAVVVLGLAVIYFAIGTLTPNTFLDSLYYSAVSFNSLGYGSWAPHPTGWVKGLGVVEAFMGVFMMALFLVTFTRKLTR